LTPLKCAVATPHASATQAAARCVSAGGNAVDAAIAAALALAVVQPHYTSAGGDLIALIRAPDGTITTVNATGFAGRRIDPDRLAARYGASMPASGVDTITVPGAVAGLGVLHSLGAALPWAAGFDQACELAADGVPASASLVAAVHGNPALIAADPGLRDLLAPGGSLLRQGQLLRQPALAATLGEIAREGPRALYAGSLADRLAAGLQASGCLLDSADLAAFEPTREAPLTLSFQGRDIATSGPNSQGFFLLEALGILERLGPGLQPLAHGARTLARIFQLAAQDRRDWLADPAAMQVTASQLLEPGRLDRLAERVGQPVRTAPPAGPVPPASPGAARPRRPVGQQLAQPAGDTVAVVTADDSGRAVCLIQSVFHLLGSGVLEPGTGILLQNRGSAFSLRGDSANRIAPRKRPAHTLMPVMVSSGNSLGWVIGTMGGTRQPQVQAQLILRLSAGATEAEALAAPRWVVEGNPDRPTAYIEDQVAGPAAAGIGAEMPVTWIPREDEMTGRAQIARSANGDVVAASDPRGEGSAETVLAAGR
jgi:gamma-glutamyltranspeptidase